MRTLVVLSILLGLFIAVQANSLEKKKKCQLPLIEKQLTQLANDVVAVLPDLESQIVDWFNSAVAKCEKNPFTAVTCAVNALEDEAQTLLAMAQDFISKEKTLVNKIIKEAKVCLQL